MGSCGCGSKGGGFSCCNKKEFVQDKLCCNFTLTNDTPATVYQTNVSVCSLVASGFIKFCGPADSFITVQFSRGGQDNVVSSFNVNEGSCVNFTVSRFDTIIVIGPTDPASALEGEICITPRYPLPH
ncbi:DUF3992 domain-containing protein [Pseudalkalibacillus hwajinpoensis]|uniref:DUF3992 domain-containing protein n=1 Tax=Guptibacillus hwajinpoensis TaxID=208199 RepID=UPI001CFCCE93|nr:S-Ena type endospore appendage [Pseudalkalibacillus hwajinpoensis]